MALANSNNAIKGKHIISFHAFLHENYELSHFVLPKKKPANDMLGQKEKEKLKLLIQEKDFYEINAIIKSRYKSV